MVQIRFKSKHFETSSTSCLLQRPSFSTQEFSFAILQALLLLLSPLLLVRIPPFFVDLFEQLVQQFTFLTTSRDILADRRQHFELKTSDFTFNQIGHFILIFFGSSRRSQSSTCPPISVATPGATPAPMITPGRSRCRLSYRFSQWLHR